MKIEEWERMLKDHLDVEMVWYLLTGIIEGFWIGYDYSNTCVSAKCNLVSADENLGVVAAYLQ